MRFLSKHPSRRLAVMLGFVAATALLLQAPQHNASAATAQYTVYGDSLASGWTDWSWDSNVNFSSTSPVASGSDAIAWSVTAAWGGLYLHTDRAVSLSPYTAVSFALRATQTGQAVSVVLQDVNDNPLGPVVKLTNYGGNPVAGSWKQYSIPLTALGASGKQLGGVIIQDESGNAEPPMYVDTIALTSSTASPAAPGRTATASPTQPPSQTKKPATATPTRTPTRTPSPSPTPSPTPTRSPSPTPSPTQTGRGQTYPLHTAIVSTTFWVGEIFNASAADGSQVCSTYDNEWALHWGGVNDGTVSANASDCAGSVYGSCDGIRDAADSVCNTEPRTAPYYWPTQATPLENPFYLDLPFDDVNDATAFNERCQVIPWANDPGYAGRCTDQNFSYMKNRWVAITGPNGKTCYGQIEDAGPGQYHDANYVFGSNDARPASKQYGHAGMDVSPALNGCLGFKELDGDTDQVSWRFVDASAVPPGPWTIIVTTSGLTE